MTKKRELGKYWPAKEAAQYLGYSTTTLRKWAAQGKIHCMISPGGKYRYDMEGFLKLATQASKDRLAKERQKLKAKTDKTRKASEAQRKASLEARQKKARDQAAQRAQTNQIDLEDAIAAA